MWHSAPRSDGPTPILVGSASSAAVGAGACQVSGSVGVRLWNWAAANRRLHARFGEVLGKLEARLYCICADFMSALAVMYPYDCISCSNSSSCSLTWIAQRPSCKLKIIAIIAIIAIILFIHK